jgi:hypothetical protein
VETVLRINEKLGMVLVGNIKIGDWFYYTGACNEKVLAIKSDDTAYEGRKIKCLRVEDGILARLNTDTHVELVKSVKIDVC